MILSELFLRRVSKHFSLKHHHSVESYKKSVLKFTCFFYSTQNSDRFVSCRERSTLAGVETPLNPRRCVYQEHPDVSNRSEEEVKQFYKSKNIRIKGTDVPKPILKFEELSLPENLQRVLAEENYTEPTPIQCLGWPVALSSRDMVGVSQTGSGKTLAYMLPAIVHASTNERSLVPKRSRLSVHSPKVLVLGPTRELVQQIHQVSRRFLQASHLLGACCYGGASKSNQLRQLSGAEICVATPGRLLDFLESKMLSLKECSYLVLDEADRMLDMGFEDQIRGIIEQIPVERQTLMWSATWPKEIRNLAEDFLNDYVHITVGSAELVANPNIEQNVYVMKEGEKEESLISLLRSVLETEACKVLVFAQTKRMVDYLSRLLKKENIPADGIHGDCSQRQRDNVLFRFRTTSSSVLIATDVASRGLDISDIGHIVNYDLPTNIEDYIHRIGRTARGCSASGKAHSFFTTENTNILKDLLSVLKESGQPVNPELLDYLNLAPWSPPPKQQWRSKQSRPYNSNRKYFNKRYV